MAHIRETVFMYFDNNVGECPFEFPQSIVLVRAVDVNPESVLARDDSDCLGMDLDLECSLT